MNYIKWLYDWLRKQISLLGLNRKERQLIFKIRAQNLTYLSFKKLASVSKTCRAIEKAGLNGLFIEAGCALGGSSILISSVKRTDRPVQIYDVFEMIPPPTEEDTQDVHDRYQVIKSGQSKGIGKDTYYGYMENLYDIVQQNLRDFGIDQDKQCVSLIKGLVQDTMTINEPVAFAHIDVDWYEPVMTCLERIFPNLAIGGSIIIDDYEDWGGCRKATDEYLKRVEGQFTTDQAAGSLKITRVVNP